VETAMNGISEVKPFCFVYHESML